MRTPVDRQITKDLALDVCAALLGMAVFGLPVLFLHAFMA